MSDARALPYAGSALRCALAVAAVALFYTGLDNYAFLVWKAPPPLWYVLAFTAIAVPLFLQARSSASLVRSPVAAWLCVYFLVTTLWAVFMNDRPRVQQALFDRYRSIGYLAALAVLFDEPRTRRAARAAVGVAVVAISCLNVAEALGVVDFGDQLALGRVPGRSAGLFINSNISAFAIVFGLAVVLTAIPRAWRTSLLTVGSLGVASTFSRGGEVCLGLLILWLAVRRELAWSQLGLAVAAVAAFVVYEGATASSFLEARGVLNENTWSRLNLTADDSGRKELGLMAWRMFQEAPFLGKGLAATIDWNAPVSSHNQYLGLAAEHGLAGLLLFPALVAAVGLGNRAAWPFALVLGLAGVFSHNLLEDRGSLLVVALAASTYRPRRAPVAVEAEGPGAAAA